MFNKLLVVTAFLLISVSSYSSEEVEKLNLEKAQNILNGCLKYAHENELKIAVAIYDVHGNLKVFARMDGTSVSVLELAQWKGKSAANYQLPTSETAKWNIPAAPNIAMAMGGIPIKTKSGKTIGGIGVSGALSAVDVACAEAGIASAGVL